MLHSLKRHSTAEELTVGSGAPQEGDGFVDTAGAPHVALSRVSKVFGAVTALSDLTLEVEKEQFLALLGPSGSGKTTALRVIAGLEKPDRGTVAIGGSIVAGGGWVPPERRGVGLVFQDYALFPHMKVFDNVAFGVRRCTRQERKEKVQNVLELVGLAGMATRYPHELSGGEQQRVALARAMAPGPEVILLDEPFSNLDVDLRARVRRDVKAILSRVGATVILVTHDQEEALSIAERVAVMMEGRILQTGNPGDVYRHPATRTVAEFLGDANFFPGTALNGFVECEAGRVPANGAANGAVEVMVRPEGFVLLAGAGLPVEVVRTEYFGHDQLVSVRLPSGSTVKVRLLPTAGFETGQQLGLHLRGEAAVFPARP
jgi:iron(III) transport system ATP-binding protein